MSEQERVNVFTNANDRYDGFGTRRTGRRINCDLGLFFEVEILPEHKDWQVGRYGSGMYGVFTRDELAKFNIIAE